jgi:omega-6 fatty acid desaturase (delta-12 desaturase)
LRSGPVSRHVVEELGGLLAGGIDAALAVLVSQAIWDWLMGVAILLHHTHPRVCWYDDPDEWAFFAAQVRGTVHVEFPRPLGAVLHHIMEHTAHHIDPRIPLYRLPAAQHVIERRFPENVIRTRFSLGNLCHFLSRCQLYDYHRRCWVTFDGRQSSPSSLEARFPRCGNSSP